MPLPLPKISIIMPVYNGAAFVNKSIDSVLSQTFDDFELITINDGSSDNTREVIKKYTDRRIAYLQNRKNQGVPKTRNKGLAAARGKYIAYCDHDDIYYPRHLERMAAVLDARRDIGLVYARYLIVEPGKPTQVFPASDLQDKNWKWKLKDIGAPLNIMHRIECTRKAGGFDESEVITKNSGEDYELWLRIADYFKCYYLKEILGEFVFHSRNRSFNIDWHKSFLYIIKKRWLAMHRKSERLKYIQYCREKLKNYKTPASENSLTMALPKQKPSPESLSQPSLLM